MTTAELYRGDCLDLMAEIPAGSVDMILADLPYGITACKWDSVIPLEPLWGHYRRVIKQRGAIVLTASQPFTSALVASNPKWFKYELIWHKTTAGGFLDCKFRPMKAHENILVFSLSGCSNGSKPAMTYNPVMREGDPYIRDRVGSAMGLSASRSKQKRLSTISDGMRYPQSVERIASASGKTLHPTQKPVALMEYLIKTYSNDGETVLDNVMGSGTTGVACTRTGRNFIGIEKDPTYFDIARNRIAAERCKVAELTKTIEEMKAAKAKRRKSTTPNDSRTPGTRGR